MSENQVERVKKIMDGRKIDMHMPMFNPCYECGILKLMSDALEQLQKDNKQLKIDIENCPRCPDIPDIDGGTP